MSDLLDAITSAAAAVPQQVKANIFQAFGRLLGAAVGVPVAYLEGKAQGFHDDTAARSIVSKAAAEAAAARIKEDPALATRAVDYYAERMLREQRNRETVAAIAVAELAAKPPEEADARPLSDDWLDMFARLSEGRSDADFRLYFGKLLAAEIRKPGSFSPATMQALSVMSPVVARLFRQLCAITVSFEQVERVEMACVICEPFGTPGSNCLSPFGLSYTNLTRLQDAGLIHTDLTARRHFPPLVWKLGVQIGGQTFVTPTSREEDIHDPFLTQTVPAKVVNLTVVGLELRSVANAEPHAEYAKEIVAWAEQQLIRPS